MTRSNGLIRATASSVIASTCRPTNGTQQTVKKRCRFDRSRLRIAPSNIALRSAWPVTRAPARTKKAVSAAERDERAVAEPDVPAVAIGTGAADSEVAAQIADSILTELIDQKVGQRALRDSTQVECGTGSEGRRTGGPIQEEYLRERWQLYGVEDRRLRQAVPEGAIVSGRRQRRKDRRVDEAIAFRESPDRRLQHGEHFRTHGEVAAVARVQSGQLTVTKEAGETGLGIAT